VVPSVDQLDTEDSTGAVIIILDSTPITAVDSSDRVDASRDQITTTRDLDCLIDHELPGLVFLEGDLTSGRDSPVAEARGPFDPTSSLQTRQLSRYVVESWCRGR
jgi:hypothetical protein